MSTWGDGALPEPVSGVRATDQDRERVIARLRAGVAEGCIDLTELEERITSAYDVRTVAELERLTADLPASVTRPAVPPSPQPRTPALEDDGFRAHLTVYLLVIGMLVGIWLLSGAGHPWPFYPAAGWGVGLGAHHQVAATQQRKRIARAAAQGLTVAELDANEVTERARRPERPGRPGGPRRPVVAGDESPTRFVVAMFVDVVGSTALAEALGDQRWAAVRRTFRTTVAEEVERHGGWEANCSGDGILARFDDPASAAAAATAILRRLERQRTDTGFAPSVRVGVHSGDAVEDGDDIIGTVVNLAARVTDAAAADEILVTEHVADHLDDRHATDGRGLHTLKGIGRPRHLLALVWR